MENGGGSRVNEKGRPQRVVGRKEQRNPES